MGMNNVQLKKRSKKGARDDSKLLFARKLYDSNTLNVPVILENIYFDHPVSVPSVRSNSDPHYRVKAFRNHSSGKSVYPKQI